MTLNITFANANDIKNVNGTADVYNGITIAGPSVEIIPKTQKLAQFNIIPASNAGIDRTELVQQKIQTDIYNENARKQSKLWLPTISIYGNYSLQNLNNRFTPVTTGDWAPFNYVGIKATFSIFDGGLKSRTRQEYQFRSQASQYQYKKLLNDYKQESISSQATLNNALSDLNYQKKNLMLAEELYKIDTDRFKNGTIKHSDLTTTYYTLQQTQTNYLNAVYNYLIGVVGYKKAIGTL